jgi:hypothetical protein
MPKFVGPSDEFLKIVYFFVVYSRFLNGELLGNPVDPTCFLRAGDLASKIRW